MTNLAECSQFGSERFSPVQSHATIYIWTRRRNLKKKKCDNILGQVVQFHQLNKGFPFECRSRNNIEYRNAKWGVEGTPVDENIPNPGMTVAVSGISSLGAQTTLFSHYTSSSSSHVTLYYISSHVTLYYIFSYVTLYYILTLHLILILACDIAMHCKLLKKCHCCTETLQIPCWPSRMQISNYNLNVWLQNRFKRGMIWSFNLIAFDKHRHCSNPHSHPHLIILMKNL